MRLALALATLLLASPALAAEPASAASRGLLTGFGDGLFLSPDAATRQVSLGRAGQAGAGVIRLNVAWAELAPTRPADPSNPADPAYRFGGLDRAVRDAAASGITPLLTLFRAPAWAEGPGRSGGAAPGSWMPGAGDFGQLGAAVARRYGGAFPDPAGGVLPRVALFQAWNEPNLDLYLSPQWAGGSPAGALHYKSLLNAFYDGIHSAQPDAVVLTAGTAPFGDAPGGTRTRPVYFWRTVLCLRKRKQGKLRRTGCPAPAKLDLLAHHPINVFGKPTKRASHLDDASSADLGRIDRVLRNAERFRTVTPPGRRPLWATEIWWETNPFDAQFGISPARQARFLEETLYLIWKGGGSAAINLQVSDSATHAPGATDQSGVFLAAGAAKPSLTAFRFPFVCERLGRTVVRAWGKSPVAGRLRIERARRGRWQRVRSLRVAEGQVFATRLRFRGKRRLRATVGTESSLAWVQR